MTWALCLCVPHSHFISMTFWIYDPVFIMSLFLRLQNLLQFSNFCLNPFRCFCSPCTVLHWHRWRWMTPLHSARWSLKYPRYGRCHLGLSPHFLHPSPSSSPSAVGRFPPQQAALKTDQTANAWKHPDRATASPGLDWFNIQLSFFCGAIATRHKRKNTTMSPWMWTLST